MPERDSSRPSRMHSTGVRTTKPRSLGGVLASLLGAIAMSVVAGVLLTAAITPVVALTGAGATSAIKIFENLPDHLNPGELAQPSTLYAKKGGKTVQLATFYDQDRRTVPWDAISQYVKDAVVAEEDPRFYSHGGVDIISTGRAILQNLAKKNISGASTVSMQYVRNVLIQESQAIIDEKKRKAAYNDAMKQTADRKLKEMKLAISIEKKYSKDEILLGYLNIALFGRQVYGIESAARYFYGKSAKDVTLAEAASLVAIVNNPAQLQIDLPENVARNTERRNKILGSMLRHGKITQAQYDEAKATPVTPKITPRRPGCSVAEGNYGLGHFCDYVQRYIRNDPSFGATAEERMFKFRRGGYQIMTTIDLDMQAAGLRAMHDTVPQRIDGIDAGGASSSVQVDTGKVLAMVQSRPFSDDGDFLKKHPTYTSINWNTDFEYGGSNGFQVGSTFKPITLTQWLKSGNSVRDVLNVNGRTVLQQSFRASCMTDGVYSYGPWTFSNDNLGIRGTQSVRTTIANSINGGVVSMAQKLDLCEIFQTAKDLGIHRASDLPKSEEDPKKPFVPTLTGSFRDLSMVPSNTFAGVDEIAPITMASAYAAFAGGGKVCTPVPIESITGPDGKPVDFTKSKCTNAISPEVAAGVAYTLQYTVTNGLASHAASSTGVPHLAKTGTTDDVVDNWTVGASTKVATATWVGNVGPTCANPRDANTCERVSTRFFGNLMYADQTIWPALMNEADRKYGGDAFPEPSESALRITTQQVPDVTGKSVEQATSALTAAGFTVVDGGTTDSAVAKGMVAKTDPAAGSAVQAGSTISLIRSSGNLAKVPDGLTGRTGADAQSALAGAGFTKVVLQCDTGSGKPDPGKDTVKSVSPGSGKEAKQSSQITLTLSCGR
ncbi:MULTISPECIES: transglycosylase domain-containing protein [unclassified Leucobacter]|uniref:transglycosylase domain-containing protein n=1 Tax=unclassified Leucobacter TaxID=2621730 RepID=UPI001F52E854|nr:MULTISPECIES: transglycosylase domain-containing protein [unclassified Leucobacter]